VGGVCEGEDLYIQKKFLDRKGVERRMRGVIGERRRSYKRAPIRLASEGPLNIYGRYHDWRSSALADCQRGMPKALAAGSVFVYKKKKNREKVYDQSIVHRSLNREETNQEGRAGGNRVERFNGTRRQEMGRERHVPKSVVESD